MIKMPHSVDLEERLLGCMINKGEVAEEAVDTLSKEVFYDHKHQTLFSNIKDLVQKERSVDIALLLEELRKKKGSFSANDFEFLTGIAKKSGLSVHYEEYVRELKDLMLRRKGISLCHSLVPKLEKGEEETEQLVDQAVRGLTGLEHGYASMKSLKEIIADENVLEELSERQAYYKEHGKRKIPKNVINTGISDIDNTLGGLYPSRLYIVGARPGLGKTALALNFSLYAATKDQGVAFFSLEMSEQELLNRYVSSYTEKRLLDIQMGCLSEEDFSIVKKGIQALEGLPLYIDQKSTTLPEIRREVRRYKREHGVQFIVIDYLQLITAKGNDSRNNRYLEVSDISRGLKLLAKEFDVTVLCLSQLSRESEKRQGKTLQLSDLRDSGSIEQDADVVMLLSREGDKVKLAVAKNRHGHTGVIDLFFDGNTVKFKDQYGAL